MVSLADTAPPYHGWTHDPTARDEIPIPLLEGPALCVGTLFAVITGGASTGYQTLIDEGPAWAQRDGNRPANSHTLRYYGNGLMFHVTRVGLRKSTDYGVTWTTSNKPTGFPAATLTHFDRDILTGRIWAVWRRRARDEAVYSSDDSGETWTYRNLQTGEGDVLRSIAVNPVNSQQIAVAGDDFARYGAYITTNGGGLWGFRSTGFLATASVSAYNAIVFADTERIILMAVDSLPKLVGFITNASGGGWTQVLAGQNSQSHPIEMVRVNETTFFLGVMGGTRTSNIFRSTDSGQTWVNLTSYAGFQDVVSMDYGPECDVLYFSQFEPTVGTRIWRLEEALTVAPGSEVLKDLADTSPVHRGLRVLFDL